ncbi:MAG: tetratricopeptide repeat protein [Planctomycetota bacterium]
MLGLAPAQSAPELWELGERAAALAAWESALAAHPGDAELRLNLAQRQMEVGRHAAALETAAPLGAEARALRATALYLLGRFEEAVLLLDPGSPDEGLLRVDALLALGRLEEAAASLEQASQGLGANDPRLLGLRGRSLVSSGQHAEAVPLFRAAVTADPLDRQALFGLGQALVRSGQRDEGLAVLQQHQRLVPLLDERDFALQSLALAPHHAGTLAALGDIERQLGLLDLAEARYRQAAARATPAELGPITLRHARLLVESRQARGAAVALLEAALLQPLDADGTTRLLVRAADLQLELGEAAQAVQKLQRAAALRPQDTEIQRRLRLAEQALPGGGN